MGDAHSRGEQVNLNSAVANVVFSEITEEFTELYERRLPAVMDRVFYEVWQAFRDFVESMGMYIVPTFLLMFRICGHGTYPHHHHQQAYR